MGFTDATRSGLENYLNFRGRASRSEYWYFVLFMFLCGLPAALIDLLIGRPVLQVMLSLAFLIPSLSALVRRLHDTAHSGWYYCILFIPLAGVILLIYWLCLAGTAGENQYGPANDQPVERLRRPGEHVAQAATFLTATYRSAAFKVDTDRPTLSLGRGRENGIVVGDAMASGKHGSIECRGDKFYLSDRSTNGTYVRANGMQEVELRGKEMLLEGSGSIGLGNSTMTDPSLCIRFVVQDR
jgi:uncharacterized membrane protein YhaH (DUF805 family)